MPDQDIHTLLFELLDQHVMRRFTAYTVHIHPGDMGCRKQGLQFLLDFFRTEIPLDKLMIPAGCTGIHGRIGCAAVMAKQFIGQLMKGQGNITVFALRYPSADFTDLVRGITPPVTEKNHLLSYCPVIPGWLPAGQAYISLWIRL